MDMISTKQAAHELGITRRRVQALIKSGRLEAEKVGRMYVIRPKDLAAVRVRKPGRQPKSVESSEFRKNSKNILLFYSDVKREFKKNISSKGSPNPF